MTNPVRVCQVVSYSADSEYTRNLGRGIAKKGADQLWVTLFEMGKVPPDWTLHTRGVNYLCLNAKYRRDFPTATLKLAWELRRRNIDIVQTHLYEASLVGLLAGLVARVPIKVLTRHHLDQAILIGKPLPIFADRIAAKMADHVVTLGSTVKEHLVTNENVPPEKIEVVYQGFDFDRFSATNEDRRRIRKEFGFAEDEIVIGTFGNFFPTKGHRFLLSAAKQLEARFPQIRLFFVGDGGGKEEVIRLANELGLREQTAFAGFRRDVPSCMKACDVVVHPSLSEAFCQVLIETMSVGIPLIATDVGGASEVIDDGVTGILIPPADPDAIVNSLTDILTGRTKAETMAFAGQTSVRERFTIEKMVQRQYELYCNWLAQK